MTTRSWIRVAAIAVMPAFLAGATLLAQDEKKAAPKAKAKATTKAGTKRLPNNWAKLDLTNEQKDKYWAASAEDEKKIDALKAERKALQDKVKEIGAKLKPLEDGDRFLSILTDAQKKKLDQIKAESARKSADKAVAKAKDAAEKATTGRSPKDKSKDAKKDG